MKTEEQTTEYYAAVVIFENTSPAADYEMLYEETVVLIAAESREVAREKALSYGKASEHSYKNCYDETITVSFKRLVDVKPLIDELKDFEKGVEVYYRYFDDYAVYRAFEPESEGAVA